LYFSRPCQALNVVQCSKFKRDEICGRFNRLICSAGVCRTPDAPWLGHPCGFRDGQIPAISEVFFVPGSVEPREPRRVSEIGPPTINMSFRLFTKLSQGELMSLRLSAREPMMAALANMYIVRRAGNFLDLERFCCERTFSKDHTGSSCWRGGISALAGIA
jgi:hypothetical protein